MRFSDWLLGQTLRQDVIGQLAREVKKDPTYPRATSRLWLILHYYRSEPVNREAAKLAHAEWRNTSFNVSRSV